MLWGTMKLVFFGAVLVAAMHFWITNKSYRFNENLVHKLVAKHAAVAGNQIAHRKIEKTVQDIVADLRRVHGQHILIPNQWATFAQGNVVGTLKILYMTPTEMLTVQGFPVAMAGHTGRFWANVSSTVLAGHVDLWEEKDPAGVMAFHAGTNLRLAWGESGGLRYNDQTWLVSYSRGALLTSLPYSIIDVVKHCDVVGLYDVTKMAAMALLNEARLFIENLMKS